LTGTVRYRIVLELCRSTEDIFVLAHHKRKERVLVPESCLFIKSSPHKLVLLTGMETCSFQDSTARTGGLLNGQPEAKQPLAAIIKVSLTFQTVHATHIMP
jgi:hypothetical protein